MKFEIPFKNMFGQKAKENTLKQLEELKEATKDEKSDLGQSASELKYVLTGKKLEKAIERASFEGFEELYTALRVATKIQGTQGTYDAEELIKIIKEVRAGTKNIEKVTRTSGLREAVKLLMKIEKEKAEKRSEAKQIKVDGFETGELTEVTQIKVDGSETGLYRITTEDGICNLYITKEGLSITEEGSAVNNNVEIFTGEDKIIGIHGQFAYRKASSDEPVVAPGVIKKIEKIQL